MTALYKIAGDYAKLMDSDMSPEDMRDTLEGIKGTIEDKIEASLAVCKNKRAYADALKAESASLAERAKTEEAQIERLHQYIADCMKTADIKSVTAGLHKVTIRNPTNKVSVLDASKIPVEYVDFETTIKPHTLDIRKLLEAGKEIPGVKLSTGKTSLLIR